MAETEVLMEEQINVSVGEDSAKQAQENIDDSAAMAPSDVSREVSDGIEGAACAAPCTRLGKVGGQAVLEGVMMKAGEHSVTTCRKDNGELVVCDDTFVSVRKKHKLLNLPIIRGVVNFIEMLKLSVKTLGNSADALGIEDEDGKCEKWMKKHLGISLTDFIMIIGTVLGVALALFLFMFLPTLVADGINLLVMNLGGQTLGVWRAVIEGIAKVFIFVAYLWLVALMPDIKRTFMYHGAEHKTIACFEAGDELTPENAKRHTRFHPRCGTSFMFFMILLGIIMGLFVRLVFESGFKLQLHTLAYTGIRLLILPLVVGIGYEFIMFAGKHDNLFVRILSAPGLWVQRITTCEPTLDMLEVAIVSTKCALRDEFPEFMEYYNNREWEKKDNTDNSDGTEESSDSDGASLTASDTEDGAPSAETAASDLDTVVNEAVAPVEDFGTDGSHSDGTEDN